jgi:hypothetical protein
MIFLVLATALCATMFMQMFGGDYDEILALTDPDNRFDTFWQSFVSLIVVYTSETWTVNITDIESSLFLILVVLLGCVVQRNV